jgi:hypothetical protein
MFYPGLFGILARNRWRFDISPIIFSEADYSKAEYSQMWLGLVPSNMKYWYRSRTHSQLFRGRTTGALQKGDPDNPLAGSPRALVIRE